MEKLVVNSFLLKEEKNLTTLKKLKLWERIFLEEGEAGFYIEQRGRTKKMDNPKKDGPKKVLDKKLSRI